ncbi:zinc transporter ZitB [Mesorhizobium sp. LSJC268A00]|uniref:cation diffusion facilitator family transporter n=1 Tax=unclassified Mesorhizobium TaxID=325217 RepID=UPI0003CE331F|nr:MULTISPECIES: cation diffusion facilitator family transporter [unclassified Mesorhizobium]ESW67678.1 zinc transporter ZitB [Mesorhizobium sp. LSJC277A00]ESX06737.1 zinc transporter ZitB [Mesorhizobium sp. LSJC268A00]ESY50240.1 zinc transporter ZitB [Mesorhizobium sp. LNJC380A00]ESY52551.1 zinc transporter ZitB [Mesorhizobium sp. LNJC374B00]ESY61544.1 zinc transporter ZitB [Mesorhizobium sp. LNJC372A00]
MAHSHDHGSLAGHGASHLHGSTDKKRVLIAACLTAGFMVAEVLGGLLTGSLALLADAGHMLADSIALGLAWYAFHLGGRPATVRLTYGFGRVKTLVAYTNGIAIFAIALWIVYEAWGRLMTPAPVLGGPMLVVAIAGLLVNFASFFVLHGGDHDSLNMRGAILHVLGDLLGSAAAIVAALVILATGWTPIDPILSVLVSVLILSTAWSLMREAAHVLLEGVPASLDRDIIAKDIAGTVKGVREVHHMHVWSLDGSSNMATLHACLNDGVDPHQAVSAIKKRLAAEHGISHATVEPEFGQCADSHDEHDHDHDHGAPPHHGHYH